MTTVADLINDTKKHLYGTHRAEYNRLTSTISASDTTLTFDFDLKGLVAGTILAIEDELLYVWSTTTGAKTAIVQRGWQGTTAAIHTAATLAEVSPRFPAVSIRSALLDEIRSWGDSLYTTTSTTVSATSTTTAYNISLGTFYQVTDVRRDDPDDETWRRIDYELVRNANTSDFADGVAIQIRTPLPTTCTLQVVYTKPFTLTTFTDAVDVTATIGLENSMLDIPPLGAAWRLLAPREVKRTFTESKGEERVVSEIPPGYITQTASNLKRLRDQRLDEEAARLRARVAWRW